MQKTTSFLAALAMSLGVFLSPAHAAKRPHKPWLVLAGAPSSAPRHRPTPSRKIQTVSVHRTKITHRPYAARPSKEIKLADKKAKTVGQKVVNQAMKYKGVKYVFGGTTKKGIDCSGLVMRVYHEVKAWQLPRTSEAMYQKGKPVKQNDLRAGDLVFFKNTYKRGISHVGIYTGGNKFIHARNRRMGVTISKLSDAYFQLHYAGARRMI